MEIIHIILGKANPNRMNGVNKVVFQLATHQAISGRKVSVWGITKVPSHDYGHRVFDTRLFQAHRNLFWVDKKMAKEIEKLKDKEVVFHIHGGWIPTFYTIGKLLSRNNLPFVFTPHGAYNTIAMKRSQWAKKLYFHLFEKNMLKKASAIHCIGNSEVDGLKRIIKDVKTCLLPYGFETDIVPSGKSYQVSGDFIIGFVGRLDIYTKGLDLLLNAFKGFYDTNKNSKLWIVGDSDQRSVLEQMIASKELQNGVVLWGSKFGKKKEDLLEKMDVFAHPSRNEGLPSSVLEAAAFGVPCLITKATNVGEFVDRHNCGITVENNNEEAIRDAMFVLDQKRQEGTLKNFGERAILMVKKEFNWETILTKFDHLYAVQ